MAGWGREEYQEKEWNKEVLIGGKIEITE